MHHGKTVYDSRNARHLLDACAVLTASGAQGLQCTSALSLQVLLYNCVRHVCGRGLCFSHGGPPQPESTAGYCGCCSIASHTMNKKKQKQIKPSNVSQPQNRSDIYNMLPFLRCLTTFDLLTKIKKRFPCDEGACQPVHVCVTELCCTEE